MNFYNIHTHSCPLNKDEIAIINTFAQEKNRIDKFEKDKFYSVGLHPWHIDEVNPDFCYNNISEALTNTNVLALGEAGLDRLVKTDFIKQLEVFKIQVNLAVSHNKPLIIHCVRAFSDIITLRKKSNSLNEWVIHGFNSKPEHIKLLVDAGINLSVGKQACQYPEKFKLIINNLPLESLFIETDDAAYPVENIYKCISGLLKIDKNELKEVIQNNVKRCFNISK